MPALATELVAKGVVAIAATGDVASARAAQLASNTVPVVFTIGGDPIRHGLIETMNRPGRHVTGILFSQNVLAAKRVELRGEIAPKVSRIALLKNPTNPNVKIGEADAEAGAKKLGLETLTRCSRLAALTLHHAMPTTYAVAAVGGLMSHQSPRHQGAGPRYAPSFPAAVNEVIG